MKTLLVMATGFGAGVGLISLLDRQKQAATDTQLAGTWSSAGNELAAWAQETIASAGGRLQREFEAPRPNERTELAPGSRLVAGGFGGALLLTGLLRRGFFGLPLLLAGAGFLVRGAANRPLGQLLHGSGETIDIRKAVTIDAPVDRVFAYWDRFENFPSFMDHVQSVQRQGERSHWTVSGPAGAPVEFDTTVTVRVPNQEIAWRTVEGSPMSHRGAVRFRPAGDGGTMVNVQMSYEPPAGALGHAVASLFDVNPKQALDDDLGRLKSLLETEKPRSNGGRRAEPAMPSEVKEGRSGLTADVD